MHIQGYTKRIRNSYGEMELVPYGPVTVASIVRPDNDPAVHAIVCAHENCGAVAKVSVKSDRTTSNMHGRYAMAVLVILAMAAASAYSCLATMDGDQLFGWFACIAFVLAIVAVFTAIIGCHYTGVDTVEVPKGHQVETISA